jgi:proline utilization trans-activator
MAEALFPQVPDNQSHRQEAHMILDAMINKGNKIAEARKAELTYLEGLVREIASRVEQQGLQTLTLSIPQDEVVEVHTEHQEQDQGLASVANSAENNMSMMEDSGMGICPNFQTMSNDELLQDIGISSDEFLSIIGQMANQGNIENT